MDLGVVPSLAALTLEDLGLGEDTTQEEVELALGQGATLVDSVVVATQAAGVDALRSQDPDAELPFLGSQTVVCHMVDDDVVPR
jgi:hypothetical protein